jgi:hypothetical protein
LAWSSTIEHIVSPGIEHFIDMARFREVFGGQCGYGTTSIMVDFLIVHFLEHANDD